MRTTVDIDPPILRELKRLQKAEGKSFGRLVSDLLGIALAQRSRRKVERAAFQWHARGLRPRVDLSDKEAVRAILDGRDARKP